MEVRPGYRQTDVGLIPEGWDVKEFGQIGNLSKGRGLLKEDIETNGAVPAIPYTALYTDFSEVVDYGQIKWFVDDTSGTIIVDEPCVLIASSSNMAANTGKASALAGTKPVAIGREVIIFRTDHSAVFLSYLLSTAPYRKRTLVLARGTTIKHLYPATFTNYRVAVPPSAEQQAITEALRDTDALLAGLDRLLVKKRDLKRGAMQQLLTGQIRLPGFQGPWVLNRLGDTASLKARIGWQGLTTAEYLDSGEFFLVTGTEFRQGYVDWSRCHFVDEVRYKQDTNIQLRPRDVLVTKDGTIGKVALVPALPAPATLNSGVFVIRPLRNSFHPEFFYYVLCSRQFSEFLSQLAAGSTISHLYQKDFVSFAYRAPAGLEEQAAIANVLAEMDVELTALEARRDKTRALKQGMMQELLTGRTRLV